MARAHSGEIGQNWFGIGRKFSDPLTNLGFSSDRRRSRIAGPVPALAHYQKRGFKTAIVSLMGSIVSPTLSSSSSSLGTPSSTSVSLQLSAAQSPLSLADCIMPVPTLPSTYKVEVGLRHANIKLDAR